MRMSNETTYRELVHQPSQVVRRHTEYFLEVDYPQEKGWRSVHKKPTAWQAAQQWIERDPPSPYPARVIRRESLVTETMVGDLQ